jgi:thymidylate synthase (FAD)
MPTVYQTEQGTRYLKEPGVVLISKPSVDLSGMDDFLGDFDCLRYLDDPGGLTDGAQLCKVAGQLCYMSFGPKRTWNQDAEIYFDNVKAQAHGSILEHANYTFLLYGISRSLTHELVRHRHFSFSQVSQRYVGGSLLRFVERPEWINDEDLHAWFEERIDRARHGYEYLTTILEAHEKKRNENLVKLGNSTEIRKKVRQAARSLLPNETEAPTIVTGPIREWRHFIEMRASCYAEIEIRRLAYRVFEILREAEPILFSDYEVVELDDDIHVVNTPYRKV